jgi:hypothetical protein
LNQGNLIHVTISSSIFQRLEKNKSEIKASVLAKISVILNQAKMCMPQKNNTLFGHITSKSYNNLQILHGANEE